MPRRDVWPDKTELLETLSVPRELLLTEQEGLVRLAEREMNGFYQIWFDRVVDIREAPSRPELPTLLLYPPPYHVVEILMMNRGWGGKWGDGTNFGEMTKINRFRTNPPSVTRQISAEVCRRKPFVIDHLYYIFTPQNNLEALGSLHTREMYWEALGFVGPAGR